MKRIPIEPNSQISDIFKTNPVCKGGLTPFNLIIHGVVTFDEWRDMLKKHNDPNLDPLRYYENTVFGKKLLALVKSIGWTEYQFAPKFRRRSENIEVECIKLLNMQINVHRES